MNDDILQSDGGGQIAVTRTGDSGTLFSDHHPNAPVASRMKLPGPAEPTGHPCGCAMFTSVRGVAPILDAAGRAACYTCGGYAKT